jgi:hypothetical protein
MSADMRRTDLGYALSGLVGLGITAVGTGFLVSPAKAAAAYGISVGQEVSGADPYLSVKGVRDVASGLMTGRSSPICGTPSTSGRSPTMSLRRVNGSVPLPVPLRLPFRKALAASCPSSQGRGGATPPRPLARSGRGYLTGSSPRR